jgi:metallo-beta-lactamase family protein
LVDFVARMCVKPKHVILVHGDEQAKQSLASQLREYLPGTAVTIG